ncbi:AXR1 [Symbiodinium natans]|uniref:NEDD8-activating enzyme E1 regulatory subunit n=1 Tax=Symbiodinium natans TaxID=878477 RepID=A0A812P905_9DINO|nr:AXR1 [Symbiodinium natans]
MATSDKYDRQLRLWGAHGQRALMDAKVCMLGSSAIATEALKNLVLPGIGQFTIVDSAKVEAADLGHNFFLEESDLGKLRSEAACKWLLEMNPDVQGAHIDQDSAKAVGQGKEFFRHFSIVIACQLTETLASQLGRLCEELQIPLILVTSLGFVGKIRLFVAEHSVCETKPDSEFGDLRLTDPFPELRRFADSIDFASLNDTEHAHVPYVVILIRALDSWRKRSEGRTLPKTSAEKDEFKDIVSKMRRSPQEANFDEALANAYKAWMPYVIPDAVQQVLSRVASASKSDFWIVARAVSQFVRDCGKLPLAGTLPDMTASTDMFIKLQEIYSSRADGDFAAITAHVATIQKELGVDGSTPGEFVKRFCQNALNCEVFRFRSLEEEFRPPSVEEGGVDLDEELQDDDSLVAWYIALRAADRFREDQNHWPGELCGDGASDLAGDMATLTGLATKVLSSYKASVSVDSVTKMVEEVVRYGGCELHTTSSVLGGIVSQEVVKLVTKQYSPLCNTLLFDGLQGKMQVVEM